MPIYCENCKNVWYIASTTFTHGICPYCQGTIRPLPFGTIIKASEETADMRGKE